LRLARVANKPLFADAPAIFRGRILLAPTLRVLTLCQDELSQKYSRDRRAWARTGMSEGPGAQMPEAIPTNFQVLRSRSRVVHPSPSARTSMLLVPGSTTAGHTRRRLLSTSNPISEPSLSLLGERYPVYLVDLPWTGRAARPAQIHGGNHGKPFNTRVFSLRFFVLHKLASLVAARRILYSGTNRPNSFFRVWLFFSKDPRVLTSIPISLSPHQYSTSSHHIQTHHTQQHTHSTTTNSHNKERFQTHTQRERKRALSTGHYFDFIPRAKNAQHNNPHNAQHAERNATNQQAQLSRFRSEFFNNSTQLAVSNDVSSSPQQRRRTTLRIAKASLLGRPA